MTYCPQRCCIVGNKNLSFLKLKFPYPIEDELERSACFRRLEE